MTWRGHCIGHSISGTGCKIVVSLVHETEKWGLKRAQETILLLSSVMVKVARAMCL
jgi:hypothetical protein